MTDRRSPATRVFAIHLPAALIVLFALLPYAWMILTSLKPQADIAAFPVRWLPSSITLSHYGDLMARTEFASNLGHSFIVAAGAVLAGLGVSLPAAYAFSRFRFLGRSTMMVAFLVINMFPVVLIIIPLFVIMRQFNLIDTHAGIIAGHATFAIPFSIWMMTSYMNAIPRELDEAAAMDGASRLQTIRLVLLPIIAPGVATTAIYIFVASWNEYLFSMMLSGEAVRTVTVALQLFIGEFSVQWGLLTAGGTIVALPVTILFLLVQRRLVSGLTAGAVKA
jgi:multiple sugar transport system permease protein